MLQRKPRPENGKYIWTNHVLQKMAFYRLSESRVKRVLRHPQRVEEGIAPETIACMQPVKKKIFSSRLKRQNRGEEIWVMIQKKIKNSKLKVKNHNEKFKIDNCRTIIISAWRYPGMSPVGKKIEIPDDVLEDLKSYQMHGRCW